MLTVWAQRQLESRTTASFSAVHAPGAVQTWMGKFKGSSTARVPMFCAETLATNRQQPHRARMKERIVEFGFRTQLFRNGQLVRVL